MTSSRAQASDARGVHLVLYDGFCGLCSHLVRWLLKHDRHAIFNFASLQSEVGRSMVTRWGGRPDELASFRVVADFRTPRARLLSKSDAALFVVDALGWPWKALRVMRAVPAALRDRVYDLVARTRYRAFGRRDHCLVPSQEFRQRFLD